MQVTPPRKPESRNVKINYKTAKRKEEIFVFLHEKKKKKKKPGKLGLYQNKKTSLGHYQEVKTKSRTERKYV